MNSLPAKRLIFDISTLARAGGQAVGIVRVVRELARFAHANRRDVVFAINDTKLDAFRQVHPDWLVAILEGNAVVDVSAQPGAARARARDRAPGPVRSLLLWLRRPRRRIVVALQRIRLSAGQPLAGWAGHLTDRLLSSKERSELTDLQGRRRTLIPYGMAVAAPVSFGAGDVLVITGSEWGGVDFETLLQKKDRLKFSVAVLIHDTIPLLFPQFYPARDVEAFRNFFHHILSLADLVIFTGRQVERDARDYGRAHGLPVTNSAIAPLGADPVHAETSRPPQLSARLAAGQYALYVSTIEPRKNHMLLLKVWKRLCAEGVPQAHAFKLALVGRAGWMVDDLLAELRAEAERGRGLMLLQGINDVQLKELYRGAAFCVYPSLYEGYGLPIVEGFQHGKAALASNGGALAEIVGSRSLRLDPRDEGAWYEALKRWIEDPQARAPYEAAIRGFRHPTWAEAAQKFFQAIDQNLR